MAVKAPVDRAHERGAILLTADRDRLDALAGRLLDTETVDQDEAYAAAEIDLPGRRPLPGLPPG